MVAFGSPTWLDAVAEKLAARLRAGANLPADRVFDYFGDPASLLEYPPGDEFVVLGGPDLPVDDGILSGGGAEHTVFQGAWPVHVFARLAADQQFRDTKFLRSQSRGLGRLVKRVATAAQQWYPGDDTDLSSVLVQPARVVRVQFSPRRPPHGWGWATVTLGVTFRADLSGG